MKGGWKGTGNYMHHPPLNCQPPPSSLSISPSHYSPISFSFPYLHPPPLKHSLVLLIVTPLMSILSEFILTTALPNSIPLFPPISSIYLLRSICHVVCGSGSYSPFFPVPPAAVRIFSTGGGTRISPWTPYRRHIIS